MFAAVLRRGPAPASLAADDLLASLRRTHPGEASGVATAGRFLAAQTLLHSTPESRNEDVPAADSRGRLLVSWLRLDNRQDLGRALAWDEQRIRTSTDPDLVLAAYDRWGTDCAARLVGDFAFALWDPAHQSVFAARDASGVKPLYYAETASVFVCATSTVPLQLMARDGVDTSVRPEWIARSVQHSSMSWDTTPFAGVYKLPPGHWLRATTESVSVHRYHQFVDDAPYESTRGDIWLESYRAALVDAVRARIRHTQPIGVETSGGLDSSTVLALIATLAPEVRPSLHAFGYVHDPLEPEYLLETSRTLGIRHTHVLVLRDQTADERDHQARRGWQCLGYPVEHPNAIAHIPFYELAQTFHLGTLHSGHGGDEFVTNSGSLALREHILRGDYAAAFRARGGPRWRRTLSVAKARWARDRPRGSRLEVLNAALSTSPLRAEVLQDAGVPEIVAANARHETAHDSVNSFVLGNRWAPFVSTRTAECSVVAASYGLDYRWPLLDHRLMQQYLSTPAVWKYGEGIGRYLHRRAVSGIVPDKVAWKPSKSMHGSEPMSLPTVDTREMTLGRLHPAVLELIDPMRWQAALGPDTPLHVARSRQRAVEISAWLAERDG